MVICLIKILKVSIQLQSLIKSYSRIKNIYNTKNQSSNNPIKYNTKSWLGRIEWAINSPCLHEPFKAERAVAKSSTLTARVLSRQTLLKYRCYIRHLGMILTITQWEESKFFRLRSLRSEILIANRLHIK